MSKHLKLVLKYCSVPVICTNVFNSPSVAGIVCLSSHDYLSFGSGHHVFLWNGEIFVRNVVVSISIMSFSSPVFDFSGEGLLHWVVVPFLFSTSETSLSVCTFIKVLILSFVGNREISVHFPLLIQI